MKKVLPNLRKVKEIIGKESFNCFDKFDYFDVHQGDNFNNTNSDGWKILASSIMGRINNELGDQYVTYNDVYDIIIHYRTMINSKSYVDVIDQLVKQLPKKQHFIRLKIINRISNALNPIIQSKDADGLFVYEITDVMGNIHKFKCEDESNATIFEWQYQVLCSTFPELINLDSRLNKFYSTSGGAIGETYDFTSPSGATFTRDDITYNVRLNAAKSEIVIYVNGYNHIDEVRRSLKTTLNYMDIEVSQSGNAIFIDLSNTRVESKQLNSMGLYKLISSLGEALEEVKLNIKQTEASLSELKYKEGEIIADISRLKQANLVINKYTI